MPFISERDHPADRRADRAARCAGAPKASDSAGAVALTGKPPVLSRAALRWWSAICLLFIAYGTLGPLGFSDRAWIDVSADWRWLPAAARGHADDAVTNLLLYIPAGIALRLLVRRRGQPGRVDLLVALALAAALSYTSEFLQQFMPDRQSDAKDIVMNFCGALLGCLLAPLVQNLVRRTHAWAFHQWERNSWLAICLGCLLLTAALMLVTRSFRPAEFDAVLLRPLDHADAMRFGIFVAAGFCLCAARVQRSGDVGSALRRSIVVVSVLAVLLELGQMSLVSHECGLLDMLIAVTGGLAGIGVAFYFAASGLIRAPAGGGARPRGGPRWSVESVFGRALLVFALLTTLGCYAVVATGRPAPVPVAGPEIAVYWIPLEAQFLLPARAALVQVGESGVVLALLAALGLALTGGRGRYATLLLLLSAATATEFARVVFLGRAADMSFALFALLAWLFVARLWRAFRAIDEFFPTPGLLPSAVSRPA